MTNCMRVVVTSRIFGEDTPYRNIVESVGGEIKYADCKTEADAVQACGGANIIIGGFIPISEAVMNAADDLEVILIPAAGYDSVDLQAATARGAPVSNVPEYAPRDIANHALALALAAAHDIVQNDVKMRDGPGWDRTPFEPIHGGTMGIVGLGRIGRELVPMARGLNMDVIAYDPPLDSDIFELLDVDSVTFPELLNQSDCISIHAPLTDVTHHMFSAGEFRSMKDSAVLVNTARGPIVDEEALVMAIDDDELRTAALDVFESEPPDGSPARTHERIVCSPHRGGASRRARENVREESAAELRRALQDQPLQNVVNEAVLQYSGEQVTTPGE
jgi:D-3-phosphoglycerate dehydrogenase